MNDERSRRVASLFLPALAAFLLYAFAKGWFG